MGSGNPFPMSKSEFEDSDRHAIDQVLYMQVISDQFYCVIYQDMCT